MNSRPNIYVYAQPTPENRRICSYLSSTLQRDIRSDFHPALSQSFSSENELISQVIDGTRTLLVIVTTKQSQNKTFGLVRKELLRNDALNTLDLMIDQKQNETTIEAVLFPLRGPIFVLLDGDLGLKESTDKKDSLPQVYGTIVLGVDDTKAHLRSSFDASPQLEICFCKGHRPAARSLQNPHVISCIIINKRTESEATVTFLLRTIFKFISVTRSQTETSKSRL